MTVAEASRRIGISRSMLYQLASERRISFYRVGGKIIFSEADVAAYLESCRVGAVTPSVAASMPRLKHLRL